jgi:four helix bundle protein
MKINRFEELDIWKTSIDLTKEIYRLTGKNEFAKDFNLKDQLRRAIISISSNIVEGFEKNNNNEFIRFLKIAKGSVGEARNQLYIALIIGYISEEEFNKINEKLEGLSRQVGSFISYLENKRANKEFVNKKTY